MYFYEKIVVNFNKEKNLLPATNDALIKFNANKRRFIIRMDAHMHISKKQFHPKVT